MIYLITEFYEKECSIKNTLFENKKGVYFMPLISLFVVLILIIVQLILVKNLVANIVGPIVYLIIFILTLVIFNKTAKKQMQILYEYKYENKKGMWSNRKAVNFLYKKEKEKIRKYLKKEGISLIKLKKYKKDMKEEIKKLKPKLISVPTICGVMFVTLYGIAITWGVEQVSSIEIMIIFILVNLFIIGLTGFIIGTFKEMFELTKIFAKDYNAMKSCLKIIDDIIFDKKE